MGNPKASDVSEGVAFAEKVLAELQRAAPNYEIRHYKREHFDRAILAISGLLRATLSPPLPSPVDPDVKRRLLSVCDTLEHAGSQAFPIDFHVLSADIRAAVTTPLPSLEVERLRKIVDLWFEPWGAAKGEMWEDLSGDRPFDPNVALELIREALSALPLDGGKQNAHNG